MAARERARPVSEAVAGRLAADLRPFVAGYSGYRQAGSSLPGTRVSRRRT